MHNFQATLSCLRMSLFSPFVLRFFDLILHRMPLMISAGCKQVCKWWTGSSIDETLCYGLFGFTLHTRRPMMISCMSIYLEGWGRESTLSVCVGGVVEMILPCHLGVFNFKLIIPIGFPSRVRETFELNQLKSAPSQFLPVFSGFHQLQTCCH